MPIFWGDVDIQHGGTICYQKTNDPELLQKALTDIQRAYPTVTNIDNLFIATWDHVSYYRNRSDEVGYLLIRNIV